MKLINKKAFYLLLASIIAYWTYQLLNVIITFATIDKVTAIPSGVESLYSSLEEYKSFTKTGAIIGAVIIIGLSSIFFFKLMGHRKQPKIGTYITVLLVFACIIGIFGIFGLTSGNLLSLFSLVIMGLVIAGYVLQKKEPVAPMPQYAAPNQYPYGQPNPYGDPNQQQNPYAQPNPYANPNPYGQPNPYNQPQNPYGQPPNPYGTYNPPDNNNGNNNGQ